MQRQLLILTMSHPRLIILQFRVHVMSIDDNCIVFFFVCFFYNFYLKHFICEEKAYNLTPIFSPMIQTWCVTDLKRYPAYRQMAVQLIERFEKIIRPNQTSMYMRQFIQMKPAQLTQVLYRR